MLLFQSCVEGMMLRLQCLFSDWLVESVRVWWGTVVVCKWILYERDFIRLINQENAWSVMTISNLVKMCIFLNMQENKLRDMVLSPYL